MMKFPKAYLEPPREVERPVETIEDPDAVVPEQQGEEIGPQKVMLDIYKSEEPAQQLTTETQIDTSWLPWCAQTYHISPNLSDYVIKNMPICPADLPNRNGVSFPLQELLRYQPPPIARQVYRAWAGCPVHLEHDNEDCTKALGVIFDTSLRKVLKYGQNFWMVYGLIGVDRTKYPDIAQRLLDGSLDTGSMGALADEFTCGVCGSPAYKEPFRNCSHIHSTEQVNWKLVDHEGQKKLAFLRAHGLSPIEYSLVADPAWATSLGVGVLGEG